MKKFKQYARLALIFALIGGGAMSLAFKYETNWANWTAIMCATVSMSMGIYLCHYFEKRHQLPD